MRKKSKKVIYRCITVGDGDSFIFRHTFVGKKAQGYAPLIARYADRDQAIAETNRLNEEQTPEQWEALLRKERAMIYWNRPYGWRAGTRYIESGASAADVIRYEQEELGNDLDVPAFLLNELERIRSSCVVWVCRTKRHAARYGQPYKEDFGTQALILANDQDNGYLLLEDATLLHPATIERFAEYRKGRAPAKRDATM